MATRKSINPGLMRAIAAKAEKQPHVANDRPNQTITNAEVMDELERTLDHAFAAALQCSGGGFESFSELNDELRDDYLCMLADMIERARGLTRQLRGDGVAEAANNG